MLLPTSYSILCLVLVVLSAAQTQLFRPAAIPIAARSPYLLSFLPINESVRYSRTWQTGYNNQIQAWAVLVRVDGTLYTWDGPGEIDSISEEDPVLTGPQQSLTPTSTVFFYQAGPVLVTITFLSPIEPGDLVKQSIPASYVALDVQTTDGGSHSIQVYTDISAEWVSGDRFQNVTWSTNTSDSSVIYHSISAIGQVPYREVDAQSAWGTIYYAAEKTPGTTYRTGDYISTRTQFAHNGTLDNTQDISFRRITDAYPVFAFSQDLGNVTNLTSPIVWAVANVRDSRSTGALTYTDLTGQMQTRSLYYRSQYTDDSVLINDFLSDFPGALNRSQALDKRITQAAKDVGGLNYADILALATRQAYCGIEITIGRDGNGNVNVSDVMVFYKDTGIQDSGDGNAQVNPVDGLLSVFPAFLYLDPVLCGALLEPLLLFQSSSNYTNSYAALNLGLQYPSAVASIDSHSQSVETSSGMIIMVYSHARTTGDHGIIERYYTLLKRWADFLTSNALDSSAQTSADGVTRNGQTNLALKGIIAVQAMSNISAIMNDTTNENTYSSQARVLYSQWSTKALASDGHLRFSYDEPDSSFSLGYNMFWDLLLGTGLIDTTTIDAQTRFISKMIQTYGVPSDSTNTSMVYANWNMLMAAIAIRDNTTQPALIGANHKWANMQTNGATPTGQFPLVYDGQDGTVITGRSSPRQGAAYAPLLVNASSFVSSSSAKAAGPVQGGKSDKAGRPVGTIVGTTLGAVASICLLVGLFWLLRRRRSTKSTRKAAVKQSDPHIEEAPQAGASSMSHPSNVTPFTQEDSTWHPVSSSTGNSSPSVDWASPELEAGTKRAFLLRRALNNERQQLSDNPDHSSASLSNLPQPGDPTSGAVLREINDLRMEIAAALRLSDSVAPPEYNG